jgi:hypothetical protein
MLEWTIRHAWRACVAVRLPWVRIPLSPPLFLSEKKADRYRKHGVAAALKVRQYAGGS